LSFDIYAWKSPRDLDAELAEALLTNWNEMGADPSESPFEPSTDVGWFFRELVKEVPGMDASSDAVPNTGAAPIWLSGAPEPPARVVGMRLAPAMSVDALDSIFGLAAKYDLVVFDTRHHRIHFPLEELATHASATFWPAGAIQASLAGGIGGVVAVAAWFLGIPLLSGLFVLVGGFMVAMAVYSFVVEGRKAVRSRRKGAGQAKR
jgi:hypothetical protein